jgi:dUTP pyrophosphatase
VSHLDGKFTYPKITHMSSIQLKRMRDSAVEPTYGSEGAAAFDLYAAEEVSLKPNETKVVPLGYAMGIESGYEVIIRPRSGIALKTGLRIANSPGTIDSDYTGEVGVIMHNTSDSKRVIAVGDRIAQGILQRTNRVHFVFVTQLSPTERGDGGMGSTGV